jgi:hypothetical protein
MQRIMAWETHHGISLDDHPFYLSTIPAQFTLEESAMAVYEALKGLDVGAVFVDTLSRNFGPGNENSTQDMAFYVTFGDRYIRQPFEALYVDVHHSGLMDDSRGRGSSVLRGALDAEFKMARFGDSVTLECTKMKNAERPPGMEFAVHPVELSTQDKGGEPISSVVLEYEGEPDTENKGIVKGMGPNQLNARAILIELYADQKKHLEGTGREPSVLHDDWKRACRKEGLNRNQFRDVEKGLDKRKIIFRKPPYVYLAGEEGESV